MNETLNILTLVLGAIQLVDIVIAIGLYFAYGRNSDYLWVTVVWVGMCLFFISDTSLGDASVEHIFKSYIFSGMSGVALGEIVSRHYQVKYSWRMSALFVLGVTTASGLLFLLGVKSFLFLSLIVSCGVVFPVFYTVLYGFNNLKNKTKKGKKSVIDYVFLGTIFIWGVHLFDYPFLRPLKNLEFSIFGFSFALVLTYLTSILLPVVVNRRIHFNLNETLEEKLTIKSEELKKAQSQIVAREKLASLGALAAGIAHEVKNPLNIIKNGAFLITKYVNQDLRQYHSLLEKNQHDELKKLIVEDIDKLESVAKLVDRNVGRADNIVKSMLEQSRTGHAVLTLEDVNKIIMDSIEFVIESTRGKYEFEIQKEFNLSALNQVYIYGQDFGRAIINIVDNSLYAMNEKYLDEKYTPKISVKTSTENNYIRIEIQDNGQGIPNAILNDILNPFFTTKPSGDGTGLGLSMVFDVIKLHEGDIEIDSVENEFTQIIIRIKNKLKT